MNVKWVMAVHCRERGTAVDIGFHVRQLGDSFAAAVAGFVECTALTIDAWFQRL
ncbi:MAG TPA: hypothetical protein VJO99_08430 [Burkholderiaceae bacterium]|nr:hypothetical protein [Burkholderiaceae bacterium]